MRQKTVTITDDDGVTWTFATKTGANELRLIEINEAFNGGFKKNEAGEDVIGPDQYNAWIRDTAGFFDEIVRGWSDPSGAMPDFAAVTSPAALFTGAERSAVFSLWHRANNLTSEQKKS